MYFIFTVLFIVTVIITQFMNNMAACGVISPIAITIAGTLGADPRAFIMAIAHCPPGCGYMTPFASGTNQRMSVFAKSTIVDYMRYGWPLIIITYLCALLILPHVSHFSDPYFKQGRRTNFCGAVLFSTKQPRRPLVLSICNLQSLPRLITPSKMHKAFFQFL